MRILLINVPHPAIGSRIPDDHLRRSACWRSVVR